jgi:ABC-2 type transport system permease protein
MALISAEWIKLTTTRSPFLLACAVTLLSLGFAAIQAVAGLTPLLPERAAIGVATFGVPALTILAALTITGEYRTGTIATTFLASPERTLVLLAKSAVAAAVSAVITAAMVLASCLLAGQLITEDPGADLSATSPEVWRAVGAITLYAALCAILGVGLGALIRHSAGVIAVVLLVPFVAEPLLGSAPRIGHRVGPLLPFTNAYAFTEVPSLVTFTMWWGPLGSLVYFTALVLVIFGAAVVVTGRRDP